MHASESEATEEIPKAGISPAKRMKPCSYKEFCIICGSSQCRESKAKKKAS